MVSIKLNPSSVIPVSNRVMITVSRLIPIRVTEPDYHPDSMSSTLQTEQDAAEQPSKTQRKKAMHALQVLGERLVALDDARLMELELPEKLITVLQEARKITKHGARRRQMQLIGKLMRDVDPTPIQQKLAIWQHAGGRQTVWLHQLEHWRDRLIEDASAVTELVAAYPQTDVRQLRTLLRNAEKEKQADKPPKSARALFRLLREIIPYEP